MPVLYLSVGSNKTLLLLGYTRELDMGEMKRAGGGGGGGGGGNTIQSH